MVRNHWQTPPGYHAIIRELVEHFGRRLVGEPEPLALSVINFNYRAKTDSGSLMVRCMKGTMVRERAELEHRAMRWANERGLPSNPPLTDASGESVFERDGRLWAVFPWLEGRSLMRGSVTEDEAALLGRTHALTHKALRDYPETGLHRNSELAWDTAQSFSDFEQVLAAIDAEPAPPATFARYRQSIIEQRDMLRSETIREHTSFDLWLQACHGDFHERNVMVDGAGDLLAVIDWERFSLSSPEMEVVRALTFAQLLEPPWLQRYLMAYGQVARLPREGIQAGIELWWQQTLHNTWTFRERFLRGNHAVEQFLEEGAEMLRRFRDPGFRSYLAAEMQRYCGT